MTDYFLGIHEYGDGHDAGIAVIDQRGAPQVILEGERFSKIKKNTHWVPDILLQEAFKYVDPARIVGVGIGQIGQALKPETDDSSLEGVYRASEKAFACFASPFRITTQFPHLMKVNQIRHHLAHIYSAFCPSPFDEALVVSVDGNGEFPEAVVVGVGTGRECKILWNAGPKASLGTLYRVVGALYCGLPGSEGEGKAMALASYGRPVYKDQLKDILVTLDPDTLAWNLSQPVDVTVTKKGDAHLMALLEARFGPKRPMLERPPDEAVEPFYADMAASLQSLVVEYMLLLIQRWVAETGKRKVCLAGGVAMNSAMNGALLQSGVVDDLFVQPASSDNGLALGAAYGALYSAYPKWRLSPNRFTLRHTYYGTGSDENDIKQAFSSFGLPCRPIDDPSGVAAQKLADGDIVGWFQGRMEYGARALGNRSILSLATDQKYRDNINLKVKNREIWRPFAPATLKEKIGTYFEFDRHEPFMTTVYKVKSEWVDRLQAVTHVDGTARVQSVDYEDNPKYYRIIEAVGNRTGVAVILNTSLNGKGHPIVRTPGEAVALFLNSDMDCLVMGNFLLEKEDKVHDRAYHNDAVAILLEVSGNRPYVAEIIKCNNPLNREQENDIFRAIEKTGGMIPDDPSGNNAISQKIFVLMGGYDSAKEEIIPSAVKDYRDSGYGEVKCVEFLYRSSHIRFTGINEIAWGNVGNASKAKDGGIDKFVLTQKAIFEKVSNHEQKNRVVLYPVNDLAKRILSEESPLNDLNGKIAFCVDENDMGLNNGIPIVSKKNFLNRMITAEAGKDNLDLIITSMMDFEKIFYPLSNLMNRNRIYLINADLELFKLIEQSN